MPVRFGAERCRLYVLTVAVRSGDIMMSPWAPVPATQRADVQRAPLSTMLVAFCAVVGPPSGLPCGSHADDPPFTVLTTVPLAPSAKQALSLTHAMPFSAAVVPLV